MNGHIVVGQVVACHVALLVLILTVGGFGGNFAVRMDQVEGEVQVFADVFEKIVEVQCFCNLQQASVGDGGIAGRASFVVLAIGIDVDFLCQPLLNPGPVFRIWEEGVEPGQGPGDHPAVVGGMDTADRQGLACLEQVLFYYSGKLAVIQLFVLAHDRPGQ